MKKIALFPGSFDPFTKGHEDIVLRSLSLFDEIIIAIGHNTQKANRYFALELMIDKITEIFEPFPQVSINTYDELTAAFAKRSGANFIVRGLRNTTDFEYENSIAQVNRHINDDLESVFLITSPQFAAISSTIIREVHRYGGSISEFIPYSLP